MAASPTVPFDDTPYAFSWRAPTITILSDHATQDRRGDQASGSEVAKLADLDRLQLQSRLEPIFDILRHKNTQCPLAIAITGDWGSGKTSAMRWLETRLKEWNSLDNQDRGDHPCAYPIWFDPWRYHSREEVWRGIIAEVILAVLNVDNLNRKNLRPRLLQAARKFGGVLGRSFLHALDNMELKLGDSKMGGQVKFSGKVFGKIWDECDKFAEPEAAYLNQFEETLRSWVITHLEGNPEQSSPPAGESFLQRWLRPWLQRDTAPSANSGSRSARIVMFIDDLDRCLPEVTLEVIEALKLYLNIPNVVFVVALDDKIVSSVIAKRYGDSGVDVGKAKSYLSKIFQVEVPMVVSTGRMPDYMRQQILLLDQVTGGSWGRNIELSGCRESLEHSLVNLAGRSPREVKRLLNSALLAGRAAELEASLSVNDEEHYPVAQPDLHPPLRFAFGTQVFVVQRWFAQRFEDGREMIDRPDAQIWLQTASKLVILALRGVQCTAADLHQYLLHLADRERASREIPSAGELAEQERIASLPPTERYIAELRGFRPMEGKPVPSEGQDAILSLYKHLITSPPRPDDKVWLSESFLMLMGVPFLKTIADHFPPERRIVEDPSPSLNVLHQLSPQARERLAAAAEVAVSDLQLADLSRITELNLSGDYWVTIAQLNWLLPLMELEALDLDGCTGLRSTVGLPPLPSLKKLDLRNCTGLEGEGALLGLAGLDQLEVLNLSFCKELRSTQGLPPLPSLKKLGLRNCTGLEGEGALLGLAGLDQLEVLDLAGCTGLRSTQGLPPLPSLKKLWLQGCSGLEGEGALLGLAGLNKLEVLDLSGCTGLRSTHGLPPLPALKTLDLSNCAGLQGEEALPRLAGRDKLEQVVLGGSTKLTKNVVERYRKRTGANWRAVWI